MNAILAILTSMLGPLFGLGAATFAAGHDILFSAKKFKEVNSVLKVITMSLGSLILIIPWYLWTNHTNPIAVTNDFLIITGIHAFLLTIAFVLYMRALTIGDLWQTQPVLGFTPVLLVITTPLMIDDQVSWLGWAGVILVGLGIYLTNHKGKKEDGSKINLFEPLRAMWTAPGFKEKISVATIFAITANLDRMCLDAAHADPTHPTRGALFLLTDKIFIIIFASVAMFIMVIRNKKKNEQKDKQTTKLSRGVIIALIAGGILHALEVGAQVWALAYLSVPAVIAIKRLSIVFAGGYALLKRNDGKDLSAYRVIGLITVAIGAGVIMIFK